MHGGAIGGSSSNTDACPTFVQVPKKVLQSVGRVLIVEEERDFELLMQDRCPLSDVTPIGTCVRIRDPSTAATALHLFPETVASSAGATIVAYSLRAPKAFKCRVVSTHRKLDIAFLELEDATPAVWMPVCAGPTELGSRLFSAAFPHLVDIAFLESDEHDVEIHTISPIVNDFTVAGNAPSECFFGSYFCNLNIKDTVMPEDDEIPSDDEGRDEMLRSILPQVVDRVKGSSELSRFSPLRDAWNGRRRFLGTGR